MRREVTTATIVAGTLDILWAIVLTLWFGKNVGDMLRYVGSGPFPPAKELGLLGAAIGLGVHYALMAVMAAAFFALLRARAGLAERPYVAGLLFGLATYVVMNWIVVPLRFGTPLPPSARAIATQLFAHLILVGMTFAWVAARRRKEV